MFLSGVANQTKGRHDCHEDQKNKPESKTGNKVGHKIVGGAALVNKSAKLLRFLSPEPKRKHVSLTG
jgi:hypothetical protein